MKHPSVAGLGLSGLLLLVGLAGAPVHAHVANNPSGTMIHPEDGALVDAAGGAFPVRATFAGDCDAPTRVTEDILSTSRKARVERLAFACAGKVWTWQGRVLGAPAGDTVDIVLDFEQSGFTPDTTHYHGVSATYTIKP